MTWRMNRKAYPNTDKKGKKEEGGGGLVSKQDKASEV
jgi:hypothetical protein